MRKIFIIFAATLIAFSFASCDKKGGNTPSDPAEKEQKDTIVIPPIPAITQMVVAVSEVADSSVHVVVTPPNDTVKYIFDVWKKIPSINDLAQLKTFVQLELDAAREKGLTYADFINGAYSGKLDTIVRYLEPNTQYFAYAYSVDEDLKLLENGVAVEFFTTLEEESYGADGFVDLGLPSGNLWKKESESVQWNTYDKVISEYGDAVPSQIQWEELINNCTWTYNADQGAYIIQGKNGNTISMACAGYRDCSEGRHYKQTEGWYWTSTATDEDNAYAAFLTHYETYDNITTDELPRCNGFSVHLIYVEK